MIPTRQDPHAKDADHVDGRGTGKRAEKIAAVVSLGVIALLITIDTVRSAPADAPVIQATFDAAPPIEEATPARSVQAERWAADGSARGTRPDSVH